MGGRKCALRRRGGDAQERGRLVIWASAVVSAAVLRPASPSSAFAKAPAKAPAKADVCPAYPRVWSWGAISHQRTIDFVGDNHGGDWAPYNGKWKKRLGLLEMAHAQGRAVVFPKPQGLLLRGRGLADFIESVRTRTHTNLCLPDPAVAVPP